VDLAYSAEYEAFRGSVTDFLSEHWDRKAIAALPKAEARQATADFRTSATSAGLLYRNIPRRYGGSEQEPDILKAQIIREEFGRVRAPMEVPGNGPNMLVPTLLEHGTDWQKDHFIPKTLTGEYVWAQGYSEPGSGSDLASVRTSGELRDGEWVINGQKIWTTMAHLSRFMFALVRTEPQAPKHQGISYLLIDLKQPGVTIRPLKQINGGADFNEVFFDDARTPADWIVGERGQGWKISRTTLKHERSSIGGAVQYEQMFARLVDLAKATRRNGVPAIEDPEVRQWLAALEGYVLSHRYSTYRQLSMSAAGKDPGIVTLMNKLVCTNIGHEISRIAQELIAEEGLLLPAQPGKGARPGNEKWINQFMGSMGVAIAGGTSNIQRNIIAERGLGLPRDPIVSGDRN